MRSCGFITSENCFKKSTASAWVKLPKYQLSDHENAVRKIASSPDCSLTNAGSHVQDASGTIIFHPRKPVSAIIVGAEESMARNVLEMRDLGQGPLQFFLGEVESVIVDGLASVLEGLKEETHFAEVA
jgi:hypothetical protein